MAKGKKKGPPYTDKPDCEYIVVTQPYGIDKNAPERMNKGAVQRISSWIRFMFNDVSVVEAVWWMRTRNEIIVQLTEGTDIEPMLGAHKWSKIVSGFRGDPAAMSCIFKYNYRTFGEPGAHSWKDEVSSDEFPPKGIFTDPYPRPSWAQPRINLALPLPKSRERTPTPPPEPEPEPASAADTAETKPVIKPEASDATELSSKLASKMDPYEEEELAQQSLRAPPPPDPVKQEPAYTPSSDLVNMLDALTKSRGPSAPTAAPVKQEIPARPEPSVLGQHNVQVKAEAGTNGNPTAPSNAWLDVFAQYQAQQGQRPAAGYPPVKPEAPETTLSARPLRPVEQTQDPRRRSQPDAPRVKPEPADPRLANLPPRPVEPTRDPRRRNVEPDPRGTAAKRPKEEPDGQEYWKRVKTENGL
ncbi:hypothetical protein DENSPDRAFT_925609 [Dentipellis sp. KUC8613]|nr:hypothetical protein DENSPDRAFT_925609 [Dentipellis sp. KUC8613]